MRCDWCEREVDEIAPVVLTRDDQIDGGPVEFVEDGLKLGDERGRDYGQACHECVDAGFTRQLTSFQRRERHERRDRAERAARRLMAVVPEEE